MKTRDEIFAEKVKLLYEEFHQDYHIMTADILKDMINRVKIGNFDSDEAIYCAVAAMGECITESLISIFFRVIPTFEETKPLLEKLFERYLDVLKSWYLTNENIS